MKLCTFVLILTVFVVMRMVSVQACPDPEQVPHRVGLLGGYSKPHPPTEEELFALRRLWFEAVNKCAEVPQRFEDIKVCFVRSQVVAGMNYEYTLESRGGQVTKLILHSPLRADADRIMSCATTMISLGES